jgi:hypothetical protein
MYVRLKHGLSALALEAIRSPARAAPRSAVAWLAAFCDLASSSPAGLTAGLPLAAVSTRARRYGTRDQRGLQRIVQGGLLAREDTTLMLPAGFQEHFLYMDRQVHRLAAVLRGLSAPPPLRGKAGRLRRGFALFDGGLFFECHEYFEDIWRSAPAPEKGFYHGVILVAAGFYHYEKGNVHGARVKLTSGIEKLQGYLPASHGVRLDRWLARLARWKARIDEGSPAGVLDVSDIPKIPATTAHGRFR